MIAHRQLESAVVGARLDHDRPVLGPVGQGVAEQVRQELADPRAVAGHRAVDRQIHLDPGIRPDGAQFVDHLAQRLLDRHIGVARQAEAAAEPRPGEVEHVVDDAAHAHDAAAHQPDDVPGALVQRPLRQHADAGVDGGERVAQIVAENRDELLAQMGQFPRAGEFRLARRQLLLAVEMRCDQVGKQREHAGGRLILEGRRQRIDGAERAEERPVGADDRHRDIAAEAVHLRRRMIAVDAVLLDVVDDDGLTAFLDLVADRGFDLQFVAGGEPEADPVEGAAGDPVLARDPGHGDEAHARDAGQDLENRRDRGNPADRVDISLQISLHASSNFPAAPAPHSARDHGVLGIVTQAHGPFRRRGRGRLTAGRRGRRSRRHSRPACAAPPGSARRHPPPA